MDKSMAELSNSDMHMYITERRKLPSIADTSGTDADTSVMSEDDLTDHGNKVEKQAQPRRQTRSTTSCKASAASGSKARANKSVAASKATKPKPKKKISKSTQTGIRTECCCTSSCCSGGRKKRNLCIPKKKETKKSTRKRSISGYQEFCQFYDSSSSEESDKSCGCLCCESESFSDTEEDDLVHDFVKNVFRELKM